MPSDTAFRRLGITALRSLPDAKQSQTFVARHENDEIVVKLTDGDLADGAVLERRMSSVESVSRHRLAR